MNSIASMSFISQRKTGAFLFLILMEFSAAAQVNFKISGTAMNTDRKDVSLVIDKSLLNYKPETISAPLKEDHFEIAVRIERSTAMKLLIGSEVIPVFGQPGDDLVVSYNSREKSGGLSYIGNGSENNTFLALFSAQFKKDFDDSVMMPKMTDMPVDPFEMWIFDNRKKQFDFFKGNPGRDRFSPAFNEFMRQQITYRYWNLLLAYPIINANSNKGLTVNGLPAAMLEGFDKVNVNNDTALPAESYREFLKYYVIYFTSQGNNFQKFTDFSVSADRKYALAKDRLKDGAFLYWLARFSLEECGRLSPFSAKKLFSALKDADRKQQYSPIISEACGAKMAMKDEKKTATPGATAANKVKADELDLTDENGKHVSLSDFKGKVVYVDFWASWCGPCRMMMPFSKQMHENLSERQKKQIVFLYISIDANPEQWKKAMGDLGIQGINVNSPGNWNSRVCRYFQIQSIPRYMILNKKGEVVEFNAKRPADPTVLDDLMKYVVE